MADFTNVSWLASLPSGTGITVQVRSATSVTLGTVTGGGGGINMLVDGSVSNQVVTSANWSSWETVSNNGTVPTNIADAQYLQFSITLTTTNADLTPILDSILFDWE